MKIKNIITVLLCGAFLFGLAGWCIFGPKDTYSKSERRELAKFPQVSMESVSNGSFAKDFEKYAVDAFPKRDLWRSLKAYTRLGLLAQKENNDLYISEGHLSQIKYPMNNQMMDYAIDLLTKVRNQYFPNSKVYFAMIPDKNRVLADLKIDYTAFENYMAEGLNFAENISISDLLTAEDYYYTDTHWRQEQITDVADRLATAMGTKISDQYEQETLTNEFYGVYAGQSALNVEPDVLNVLTNDIIRNYRVMEFNERGQVKKWNGVYDESRLDGDDAYETFLGGAQAAIKITNPNNPTGKRLIVFRDSFGSSIIPLLAQGYKEVVILDLRYIHSDTLSKPALKPHIGFGNADVLFLYSSLVLNDSMSLK